MCGIAGFWTDSGSSSRLVESARLMTDRIAHRGPDAEGIWVDEAAGLALGHRRLAILDLSPAGHQPMCSASGRYVIVYNGEIYNHIDLRRALEEEGAAPQWRGHSDTESLLAAVEMWGVQRALECSKGMFAVAIWDRVLKELWLARDRFGEKPLYYGWQGKTFLFGSELKALRAHPSFNATIDRGALSLYLQYSYVPEPFSIWEGVSKLPPGTYLRLRQGEQELQPVAWWSLKRVAEAGVSSPYEGSDQEAIEDLEKILGKAIEDQMVADVPLGALLSGGIDSTLVTALMQARSGRAVRTFTIGFHEKAFDEACHAHRIAAHLGTEHTELYLSGADAIALVPTLPDVYDEPFADSSQLPTQLVMRLARQHVKVALTGDAGDEVFGGYNRYILGPKLWRRLSFLPAQFRRIVGRALTAVPASTLNNVLSVPARVVGVSLPGDKAHKLGQRMRFIRSIDDMYISLVKEWHEIDGLIVGRPIGPKSVLDCRENWPRLSSPIYRMMALDAMTYLPGDVLTKVDRAAMSVSLETRAPFLDRDVVEFGWTLPERLRIRDGKGKWLLRQVLGKYVPRTLVERPKQGFGIPIDDWLRGPLRDWAEQMLDESRLRREGYLEPGPIRDAWRAHLRRDGSFGHRLWSVLMFQAWLESALDR
ncbi:asparagine synthase (glutamine-hydrolyzing) [Arenimonas caeni]|uniref:asparagine synthase (glutamine-hydrolyzing) n=1 Tax=Arenimonas caeni TaxID=2058085 RepID=A0A2P6MBN0_9GAMM|nr:asparagine synthase (glutamine-hydrolyzing) [Arenimonas caeni]PRH83404.1 asparagine synthase (glutamine-hydrolyzing) [Arenimonas caeni]